MRDWSYIKEGEANSSFADFLQFIYLLIALNADTI